MTEPKLILQGTVYRPKSPTMKTWRKLINLDMQKGSIAERLELQIEIISMIYGVSEDDLSSALPVDEVIPTYVLAAKWVMEQITEKANQLPKV